MIREDCESGKVRLTVCPGHLETGFGVLLFGTVERNVCITAASYHPNCGETRHPNENHHVERPRVMSQDKCGLLGAF